MIGKTRQAHRVCSVAHGVPLALSLSPPAHPELVEGGAGLMVSLSNHERAESRPHDLSHVLRHHTAGPRGRRCAIMLSEAQG